MVDDDALMHGLLAEWLSEAGYRVRQAENGANALKLGAAKAIAKLFERHDLLAAVEEVLPREESGAVRV